MERRTPPSLVSQLERASPRLRFLQDCFHYSPGDRPSTTSILRGLHQV